MEQCEHYGMEYEIGPDRRKIRREYCRYGSVKTLVESGVTAIIANGESESGEVLAGIRFCGKVVPRDLSLICREVPSFRGFPDPPLTTISQDFPRPASPPSTCSTESPTGRIPSFRLRLTAC